MAGKLLWGDTNAIRAARVLRITPVKPPIIAHAINSGMLPVYGLRLVPKYANNNTRKMVGYQLKQ
jgi:hypothetical protein